MKLTDLHRIHARHLTALRRAPGTISYYRDCVKRLSEFLESQGLLSEAELVTRRQLQEFPVWLRERGLAPGGEHAVMRGVRATLRWVVEEEMLEAHPTARLRLASVPQATPPAVLPAEAREALRVAATTAQPLRNRAILLTMLDTGVRMSELLQLRVADVDLAAGMLRVRAETSKRQKERYIPLGVKVSRAITGYERREREPASPHVHELFLNRSGRPLSKGGLHNMLERIAEEAKLPRSHLAPHAWRRGFATEYLRHGGDIATLQQLMGHATIGQVAVYLRLTPDDLQRAHLRASPADRL